LFTSLVTVTVTDDRRMNGRTDKRTDGQLENIMPLARLAWRRHKTNVIYCTRYKRTFVISGVTTVLRHCIRS